MVEIKTLKIDVVFFLILLRIQKGIPVIWFFGKRTIIMSKKDDHES